MTMYDLPHGFQMRSPTTDDLDEVAALLVARDRARPGAAQLLDSAMRAWIMSIWETSGFDVLRDARVVITPHGEIVGYITVWRPDESSGYVVASPRILPAYLSLDLDAALLTWAEALAREKVAALPSSVSATLNAWVDGPDPVADEMLARAGFALAQRYQRMKIDLHTPLLAPAWPDGVRVRSFVAGQDERTVYDLMQAAFAGVYNYDLPYEEWFREVVAPESADSSLWTLAMHGDELVGAIVSREDVGDDGRIGWLEDVGVHPAWRKRGLGLAMLYHSFGVFYARGVTRCGLSVDIQNASGATRLYERAGMTPQPRQELRYEKALR